MLRAAITVACLLIFSGCASIISSTTDRFAGNLSRTILNSDDPETVADGAPAYLLLLDSLLLDSPDDPSLLLAASGLYSAYASVFVTNDQRVERMTNRALDYALKAVCVSDQSSCDPRTQPFNEFSTKIHSLSKSEVPGWFALGAAWAGWINANNKDLKAVAQLSRVRLIMERMVELKPAWQHGGPHVYMGVLSTLLPPGLGGKPELGKQHFEEAIRLSDGKNLMAKVLYAEKYARLVFDQPLHDRLLKDVLTTDPHTEGLTLMNILAQKKAAELLESGKEYF